MNESTDGSVSSESSDASWVEYNRNAWDGQVARENRWTKPVTPEEIERARQDDWSIVLTPAKPIPRSWFPPLQDCAVLCGGQQGPILAAAGAKVTVFDNSDAQLGQDRLVAEREGLSIDTVQGDMADLHALADETFDLIVHPCSNTFVPDVRPVWREAFRVLKTGGSMLSGFCNPIGFIFDYDKSQQGILEVRHSIPYSDAKSLSEAEQQQLRDEEEPFCFGHTLDDQIGGQIDAGFSITGFYEDKWNEENEPLDRYISSFIATRATVMSRG